MKWISSKTILICFLIILGSCLQKQKQSSLLTELKNDGNISLLLQPAIHNNSKAKQIIESAKSAQTDTAYINNVLKLLENRYNIQLLDSNIEHILSETKKFSHKMNYKYGELYSGLLIDYNEKISQKKRDSILQVYLHLSQNIQPIDLQINILQKIANEFSRKGSNQDACRILQKAILTTKKNNRIDLQSQLLVSLSIFSIGIDKTLAINSVNELIQTSLILKDSSLTNTGYNILATIYQNERKYKKANIYANSSLQMALLLKDSNYVRNSLSQLININSKLKNDSIVDSLFSIYRQWSSKNISDYERIANIYTLQNRSFEAIKIYDTIIKICNKNIDSVLNLGKKNTYYRMKFNALYSKMELYFDLKNYDSAKIYHQELHQILIKKPNLMDEFIHFYYYYYQAKLYLQENKFNNAFQALDSSITNLNNNFKNPFLKEYMLLKSEICYASQDFKCAYLNYKSYTDSNNITNQIENEIKFQEIEEEYREKEIEQQNLIAAINLNKQKTVKNISIIIVFLLMIFSFFILKAYKQKKKDNIALEFEKQKSESLLLNILPSEIAEELKATGDSTPRLFDEVTVMFTDFKNFTQFSESLSPKELVDELNVCFKAFDHIITKYNIEKIKTMGDGFIAASGLPVKDDAHAANMVKAALEIRDFMIERKKQLGHKTFEIRIGLHSGKVVAGIVGVKKYAYDIWGDTVNTAARMEQSGEAGQVNISETTYELVKHDFQFTYRGELEAKNKGKIKMYFVHSSI